MSTTPGPSQSDPLPSTQDGLAQRLRDCHLAAGENNSESISEFIEFTEDRMAELAELYESLSEQRLRDLLESEEDE